jgi:hypothetical protein
MGGPRIVTFILALAALTLQACDDTTGGARGGNSAPVARDGFVYIALDTPGEITALADDADGDVLTFNMNRGPAHGTANKTGVNTWVYAPLAGYEGPDSFTFRANDGARDSNTGTITIGVGRSPDQPLVASTDPDHPLAVVKTRPELIVLEGEDPLGQALAFYIDAMPLRGALEFVGGNVFLYTPFPDDGYEGPDLFTFYAETPDFRRSNRGTVHMTIALDTGNAPPVAHDRSYTVSEDGELTINLRELYSDDDDDFASMAFFAQEGPGQGSLDTAHPDRWTYRPAANYNGTDFFTFMVVDSALRQAEGRVDIAVEPVPDAPVAFSRNERVRADRELTITLLARDDDGDSLTYYVNSGSFDPRIVTFSYNGGNTCTFQSLYPGEYSFSFHVSDGEFDSAPATVTIEVTPPGTLFVKHNATGDNDGSA